MQRNIPTSLSVVSYLFLFTGMVAAIGILNALTRGSMHIDFDVLGCWMFFGLRHYSRGWRTCALIYTWLWLIGLPVFFIYGFCGPGPAYIKIFDHRFANIPVIWVSVFSALFFPLELWKYRVLTRPDIRSLFYVRSPSPAA